MTEEEEGTVVLHYAPRTRSFTALWLLEELGIPYELDAFNIQSGRHKKPDFLAINPMGKVPVVVDNGTPVSELGAIAIYLADRYSEKGLAPSPDNPARAEYLRWVFFASAIMEPAYGEKFWQWDIPASQAAWGSFDQMLHVLNNSLSSNDYLVDDHFSAADVLVGSNARFGIQFGAIADEGPVSDYVKRLTERDGFQRAAEIEEAQSEKLPDEEQ
jgi:glutathione S-transferase